MSGTRRNWSGAVAALGMVAAVLWGATGARGADNLFDIDRKPAQRAYVTVGPEFPVLNGPQSAMTRRLAGVLAELDLSGTRQLRSLVGRPMSAAELGEGARRVCIVQLLTQTQGKSVEILRSQSGDLAARELREGEPEQGGPGTLTGLDSEKFLAFSAGWSTYRGAFDEPPFNEGVQVPVGTVVQLQQPYAPGWLRFDQEEISRRFARGKLTEIKGSDRPLGENLVFARVPRDYDPRRAWGLLVWVSASYLGQPPESLHAACDELGLVCVGPAGAGNDRELGNRVQLIFDAMATASERFHIDPRRVYATGISGGGKISSMMWACFPDVFAGAVPIVGLACYEPMPVGNGQVWPANYERPDARVWAMLRARRCGSITGNKDFNHDPMQAAMKVFEGDGLDVKIWVKEMGHEMPRPVWFTEAMRWVDEPYRKLREAEEAKANAALEKIRADAAASKLPVQRRKRLVEVTALAPWSQAAWDAVEMLKDDR